MLCAGQRIVGGLGDEVGAGAKIGTHHGDVDDPVSLEGVTGSGDGLTGLNGPKQHGLLLDGLAPGALDGTGHPLAHAQLAAGRAGDGVYLELRDVARGELEDGSTTDVFMTLPGE